MYELNGYIYSLQEIQEAAARDGMTVEEFIQSKGMQIVAQSQKDPNRPEERGFFEDLWISTKGGLATGSGVNEAFIGGLPNLIGTAGRLLRSPGGIGSAIGTAVGGGLSLLDGGGRPLRITRKMKRLAQQAYQLAMMDLGTATSLFAQLSGVSVDERTFVLILTKRFRNDGPVVTKAALRKTKTTIRRLKNMCDMYDSLRPRATARRRTTGMKRATTTLIKN